jgi:hypothetical protein
MLLANARTAMEDVDAGLTGNMWLIHGAFLLVALAMLYGGSLWARFKYLRYRHAHS